MSISSNIVYGYADPRDGALRYVGKSSSGMTRPSQFGSHSHRCGNWIKSLAADGIKPKILVLDALSLEASAEELNFAERSAISKYRRIGCDLTNLTDGGDGPMRGRSWARGAGAGRASVRDVSSGQVRPTVGLCRYATVQFDHRRSRICRNTPIV